VKRIHDDKVGLDDGRRTNFRAVGRYNMTDRVPELEHFVAVLGNAVVEEWSTLPQAIQERLFERAVTLGHRSERDEMLREQLAKFLHDHHERTKT
jgi:hypothetical protein